MSKGARYSTTLPSDTSVRGVQGKGAEQDTNYQGTMRLEQGHHYVALYWCEELWQITLRGRAESRKGQKEFTETTHRIKKGKGSDHPKVSCWDAGDPDRGEGMRSETISGLC